MDRLVSLVGEIHFELSPKYNKHYVGLASGGVARNFVTFIPRKANVLTQFRIPQDEELTGRLNETGLNVVPYGYGNYRARVRQSDIDEYREVFLELMGKAHNAYRTL